MEFSMIFFLNSILMGVALAMDAFSVSVANGLAEPHMKKQKRFLTAGTYSLFQFMMPLIGWFMVHTLVSLFTSFQPFIPWTALILLCIIGGKMLLEGIKDIRAEKSGDRAFQSADEGSPETGSSQKQLSMPELAVQGIATSIDALSVGFTISDYSAIAALTECVIIAAVTLVICLAGLFLGRKLGSRLAGKAPILGGIILIAIGLEIFISHL